MKRTHNTTTSGSTPAITDLAVCRSFIGGGNPVEKPDTDTDNGQLSSKDKK